MTLPHGTATFLFSDIEGSTRLARSLDATSWASVLADHDAIADQAVAAHGGVVVKHEGDGVFAAFPDAGSAVAAAVDMQRDIARAEWAGGARVRVRIGLHTGVAQLTAAGTDYVGVDVHYAARVGAAANGGQVLLSDITRGLVADRLPAGTTLADQGRHRVRDFDEPVRLHRLVIPGAADDERPLRTLGVPSNLPAHLSSFVGRDRELNELVAQLRSARLVTLSGPAGTGKTRLSIAAAERVQNEFPGGTWFVGLSAVRDPTLVPSAIANELGIEEEPGRPIDETLKAALRDREALLVLDNFEQVVEAAPFVADLLKNARALRVLVSTREVLRLVGEYEYRVPPLGALDSIALFVERARSVRPDFQLADDTARDVAEICRRLDHLPLAIELAAARTRLFPPSGLLARLERSLDVLTGGARDLPERQRTLRAAIAWSHDLLVDEEQALFRRLAVFAGGWTVEAAEAVCDPGGHGSPVPDGILALADQSLVVEQTTDHGEPRFHCLATIREFGLEQLANSGEQPVIERRHAEFVRDLAERAEPELEYGDPGPWLDRLEHELHNVRAAIEWSLRAPDIALGMQVVGSAWRFWHHRSRLREGRDWCTRLLGHPDAREPSPARFKALVASGGLAYWLADYPAAHACYIEALEIGDALADDHLRAEALYSLGFIDMINGDRATLRSRHEESARLFTALGDPRGLAKARQGLVLVSFLDEDWERARQLAEEDNAFQREIGAVFRVAEGKTLVAAASYHLGDLAYAAAQLREALDVELEQDMTVSIIGSLIVAALIAIKAGDAERGARILGTAQQLRETAGSSAAPMDVLHLPDPADLARAAMGDDAFEAATRAGRLLTVVEAVDLVAPGVASNAPGVGPSR